MMIPREILEHVFAEPFRPFRIHTASGRDYEIRHPEMAKVGRTTMIVYAPPDDDPEGPERWHKISMMLIESIEPLDSVTQDRK